MRTIAIRMHDSEAAAVVKAANKANEPSVSAWARRTLLEAAGLKWGDRLTTNAYRTPENRAHSELNGKKRRDRSV